MTKENWNEFSTTVDDFFNNHPPQNTPWKTTQLNKAWNFWAAELKRIINKHIPFTFSLPKTFHSLSLKATKLHLALKLINKLLCDLTIYRTLSLESINQIIQKITTITEISILPLTQSDVDNPQQPTIDLLKHAKRSIWLACNLESKQKQNNKIEFFVNCHCQDMQNNTSCMIDSILRWYTDLVRTDKIILPDKVLTKKRRNKEPHQITFHLLNQKKTPKPCL